MRKWIDLMEGQTEATLSQVSKIVDSFADRLSRLDGPHNEVYAEEKEAYAHLFLGGYPEDGFSEEKAKEMIQPLVDRLKPMGWFLAKRYFTLADDFMSGIDFDDENEGSPQIMGFFDFFPMHGQREPVPQQVWHVSPRENRESILTHGLQPRTGGTDHIETENGRIYVVCDEYYLPEVIKDMGNLRDWRGLDVWEIASLLCPGPWYQDVEIPGGAAAWTPNAVPPNAMTLLRRLP